MSDKLKVKKSILETMDNLLINSSINNSKLTNQFGGAHSRGYTQLEVDRMMTSTTQQFMMLCQQAIYEKQRIQNEINKFSNKANNHKHIIAGTSSIVDMIKAKSGGTSDDSDSDSGKSAASSAASSTVSGSSAVAVTLAPLPGGQTSNTVPVIGIVYKDDDDHNFMKMIQQPKYTNSLFIFNDNVKQHATAEYLGSGGNGPMRRYNKYGTYIDRPRSAGIPTGDTPGGTGFATLGQKVEGKEASKHIDEAIAEIKELMGKHKYDKIFYSSKSDGMLGIQNFTPNQDVLQYITHHIHGLSKSSPAIRNNNSTKPTSKREAPYSP